jgi:hypothetical protein
MIAPSDDRESDERKGDGRNKQRSCDHGDREDDKKKKKGSSRTSRVSGEVFAAPPTCVVSFASSNDAGEPVGPSCRRTMAAICAPTAIPALAKRQGRDGCRTTRREPVVSSS